MYRGRVGSYARDSSGRGLDFVGCRCRCGCGCSCGLLPWVAVVKGMDDKRLKWMDRSYVDRYVYVW